MAVMNALKKIADRILPPRFEHPPAPVEAAAAARFTQARRAPRPESLPDGALERQVRCPLERRPWRRRNL